MASVDDNEVIENVIVWEWEDDRNNWTSYDPVVSNFIEQNRPSKSDKLNLGPADRKLSNYCIDIKLRKQVNVKNKKKRAVRRVNYPIDSAIGSGVLWQFEGDDGEWLCYDPEVSDTLEDAICHGESKFEIQGVGRNAKYTIDFGAMTQTRISTGKVRNISRTSRSVRYLVENDSGNWADLADELKDIALSKERHTNNTNKPTNRGGTNTTQRFESRRKERKTSEHQKSDCEYKDLCHEFRNSLGLSKSYFDGKYNKCYCSSCYTGKSHARFGKPPMDFSIPTGWYRFALKPPARAYSMKAFRNWHRAFHGTGADKIQSILEVGELAPAGRNILGGKTIAEVDGHYTPSSKPAGFDTKQVFMTPSIHYSSSPVYCKTSRFTKSGQSYNALVTFQVLVNPDSYKIGPETIGAGSTRLDPVINNSQLEWMTSQQGGTILYGLLVKLS